MRRPILVAALLGLTGCVADQCNMWWDAACREPFPKYRSSDPSPDVGPGTPWPDMGVSDGQAHNRLQDLPPAKVEPVPGKLVCRNEPKYAWSDDVDGPMPVVRRCYLVPAASR
jgi:hypothetical protein